MFVAVTFPVATYANAFFMQERTLFKRIEYSGSSMGFR